MNAINTSSSGPPTVVSPTQPATQATAKQPSATRPTTPFMALLTALGATDAGSASVASNATAADAGGAANIPMGDVGGVAGTMAADVVASGDSGSVVTRASPQTQSADVVPSGGRRRHDESVSTPAFAFGVPVTIAAIPIASLTTGTIARPQALAVSGTAMASPAPQGNGAQDGVSATPLAVGANVADQPPISALAASAAALAAPAAALAAPALAATPGAGNAPVSVAAGTNGQSGPTPFTQAIKADTTLASTGGAALAPLATTSGPQSVPTGNANVGVLAATANGATVANVAAAAVPLKSARHDSSESLPADAWAANIGPVSGAIIGSGSVAAPAHPAVTGAAQQIATQATLLHNGQSAEMQMRLRPPDLGDVRVILRRDATGALSAHLIPATREAGDVLNANLHHLRAALDQHSQGQRAAVSVGQHNVADQRQHMQGGHSSHEDETSASDPAAPPAKGNQPAAQRVGRAAAANGVVDYDA